MSNKIKTLFIIISAFTISAKAQDLNKLQETFLEAEYFFLNEDYSDAVTYYLPLYEKMPDNANIAYRIGASYLNIPGKKNFSISYLETASKNISPKHKEGTITQTTAPYDALFMLGKAYLVNYKFDKAKETYIKYSKMLSPEEIENLDFVKHEIQICENAKELIANPVSYTEENLGELFNDEKPNFNPVISADGKSFAYMVSLKFYDAIMFSNNLNGKWTPPVNITPELQADGDIYLSSLSSDGKILIFSKDDNVNSDLYSSLFDGKKWTPAVKIGKNINTKYWESHGSISEDGNQIIFSSDRPGGFGGLDLYVSRRVKGGWSPAVNLGADINTQFNEDRAFLINNGKTLIFSSQGHKNIGGYDIFRSDIQPNNKWGNPENIGYPINSPDDNLFFMPADKGRSGYYSLFKESGGSGKEDIYKVTLK